MEASFGQSQTDLSFPSPIPLNADAGLNFDALAQLSPIAEDRLDPADVLVIQYRLGKAYADLGTTFYDQAEFNQAIQHFQKALEAAPDLPKFELAKLHCNIGLALVQQHEFEQAISRFKEALELNPEDEQAKFQIERMDYEQQNIAKGLQFSQDWFSRNIPILKEHLQSFIGKADLNALEIGCWEGRSACWFLENILTHDSARLTCIDLFEGSSEHQARFQAEYLQSIETTFDLNLKQIGIQEKVKKSVGKSVEILRSLSLNTYNLIYIDGSHFAQDVLTDAVLSWGLLKPQGLMIFDDYDFDQRHPDHNTKLGIDAFLLSFAPKIHLIHKSHLVILEKLTD
jgi:tetratricopeptide (TPR) repeat protein